MNHLSVCVLRAWHLLAQPVTTRGPRKFPMNGKAADGAAAGECGAGLKLPPGGDWNYTPEDQTCAKRIAWTSCQPIEVGWNSSGIGPPRAYPHSLSWNSEEKADLAPGLQPLSSTAHRADRRAGPESSLAELLDDAAAPEGLQDLEPVAHLAGLCPLRLCHLCERQRHYPVGTAQKRSFWGLCRFEFG